MAMCMALAASQAEARSTPSAPTTAKLEVPRTRGGRIVQRVGLNLRHAVRQIKQIASNREIKPWCRMSRALRAAAGSLGIARKAPVLLYQGAFDPVHRGHLANLEAALKGIKGARQVYVVPTSVHPGKTPVAHHHRVTMMQQAVAAMAHRLPRGVKVEVVDDPHLARLSLEGFGDLTQMIHSRHPGSPVYIMTGADAFITAKDKGLVSLARAWGYRYAVTPREGYSLPDRLPCGVEVMPMSGGSASGSRARAALAAGRLPRDDLIPGTLRYIVHNGLYGSDPGRAP